MFLRLLIIIIIVLIGAAVFSHLKPSADKSENSLLNGLGLVHSWFTNDVSSDSVTDEKRGTVVYKWQDENGDWQFSNQPPPEGVASIIKVYRSDTNVTQAVETPEQDVPTSQTATSNAEPEPGSSFVPMTDPQAVKQLIEEARKVQKLADERQRSLNQ